MTYFVWRIPSDAFGGPEKDRFHLVALKSGGPEKCRFSSGI
jgi:hypothetical protein